MAGGYNTRQRQRILDCLLQNRERHVTVDELLHYLQQGGETVGRTTAYRYLDRLLEEGKVRRFSLPEQGGACYQYIDSTEACQTHYHLKCLQCGGLFHLACDLVDEIANHIKQAHSFQVDSSRTVFYGICKDCAKAREGETND